MGCVCVLGGKYSCFLLATYKVLNRQKVTYVSPHFMYLQITLGRRSNDHLGFTEIKEPSQVGKGQGELKHLTTLRSTKDPQTHFPTFFWAKTELHRLAAFLPPLVVFGTSQAFHLNERKATQSWDRAWLHFINICKLFGYIKTNQHSCPTSCILPFFPSPNQASVTIQCGSAYVSTSTRSPHPPSQY